MVALVSRWSRVSVAPRRPCRAGGRSGPFPRRVLRWIRRMRGAPHAVWNPVHELGPSLSGRAPSLAARVPSTAQDDPRAGGAGGAHPRLSLFPRGLCTTSSWPGRIAASLVRMLSTSGRRSTMRFDGARMIRIRSPRPLGFCWCARPRSMLSSASKCSLALCSNAPFSVPAQPSAWTLLTSWPASSAARACGRFSSSRTRTANNVVARQTERGARLFLRH